jgi:uncharacterized protein
MILPCLYIHESMPMGRGVFTSAILLSSTIIEISPVIVLDFNDKVLVDQTLLHDYIFHWGESERECCVALGYLSIYNHSYQANAEYEMNFSERTMQIKTIREISSGEEIFINYNGTWNDPKAVWFDQQPGLK